MGASRIRFAHDMLLTCRPREARLWPAPVRWAPSLLRAGEGSPGRKRAFEIGSHASAPSACVMGKGAAPEMGLPPEAGDRAAGPVPFPGAQSGENFAPRYLPWRKLHFLSVETAGDEEGIDSRRLRPGDVGAQ